MKAKIQNFLYLTPLVLFAFMVVSCQTSITLGATKGNGTIKNETRTITEKFEKIEVNSGIELTVSQNNNT